MLIKKKIAVFVFIIFYISFMAPTIIIDTIINISDVVYFVLLSAVCFKI